MRVRRPHRRHLRHDQPLDECLRETAASEEIRHRLTGEHRTLSASASIVGEHLPQLTIEAQQLKDHPLKAHAGEIARLAEQTSGRARVLEVFLLALDREAHVRWLCGDPDALQ